RTRRASESARFPRQRPKTMAPRRKTATARRAPARSSRPARKRAAPARRARREPLLAPHQYRDLAGLALCALAAFSALVVWAGAGGGRLGGALRSGLELTDRRAHALLP